MITMEEALLHWYKKNGRKLPWRKKNASFYEVLLSETMLQQTRVDKVIQYYSRFLERYPDLASLSQAREEDVLKLWEGLGYYSRARNLLKAAKVLAAMDELPRDVKELLPIPGIGEYTAKAILAIAFHQRAFAVDGNLLRVHSRLTKAGDLLSLRRKEAESFFLENFPKGDPSDINQALMDLGELCCLPNGKPLCERCPLKESCLSHQDHVETEFPPPKKKAGRAVVRMTVFLIIHDGQYAIRKRPREGLLSSLYEFPNIDRTFESTKELRSFLEGEGLVLDQIRVLKESRHLFSHRIWEMQNIAISLKERPENRDWIFISKKEFEKYTIPSAFQQIKKEIGI